jgi:hypothetical protein
MKLGAIPVALFFFTIHVVVGSSLLRATSTISSLGEHLSHVRKALDTLPVLAANGTALVVIILLCVLAFHRNIFKGTLQGWSWLAFLIRFRKRCYAGNSFSLRITALTKINGPSRGRPMVISARKTNMPLS